MCAPDDALGRRRSVSLSALRERPLALNRWGAGAERFVESLSKVGVSDEQLTECSDGLTAIRLALHHGHVALVTASLAAEHLAAAQLVRLNLNPPTRWSVPLACAYRFSDRHAPTISAIRHAVVDSRA